MSDPLSVIASIAGLVQISAKIIGIATQLYSSGKDAPTSICRIKDEMGQLNLIFKRVQSLIEGYERNSKSIKRHRLTLLPLHDLMTILTGCVLAYSALDKTLSQVAGLDETNLGNPVPQTQSPSCTGSFLMRVKWALWKESEAVEMITTIERHKSSLLIMLVIIQGEASSADTQNLETLRDLVEKISDKIAETHNETSVQLRELISRHHEEPGVPASGSPSTLPPLPDPEDNSNYTTSRTNTTNSIAPSSSGSAAVCLDDRASIRTTATTISLRSIRLIVPSFSEELKNSRVYKQVERLKLRRGTSGDSDSIFSKGSGESKGGWSMLSDLSLGDLSEISVLELPIDISELYDPTPYWSYDSNATSRKAREGIKLSLIGRLHAATHAQKGFVMKTLLNLGADIEEMDGNGRTPLSHAAASSGASAWDYCKFLLERGATADSVDYTGRTPLSYAAGSSRWYAEDVCQLLLDNSANINSVDNTGRTPLSYAAGSSGWYADNLCQLLLDNGANVNSVDNTGRTPLSYAADTGKLHNYKSCKILLDKGATADSSDASGRTPLSYAAGSSGECRDKICQLLLDNGATVNSFDISGKTPLDYVKYNYVYNLLVEHGAMEGSKLLQSKKQESVTR